MGTLIVTSLLEDLVKLCVVWTILVSKIRSSDWPMHSFGREAGLLQVIKLNDWVVQVVSLHLPPWVSVANGQVMSEGRSLPA